LYPGSLRWESQQLHSRALQADRELPFQIASDRLDSVNFALASSTEVHEIKFDGYRVQVHLANEAVKVFTRRGHDWTHRFKKIADDAWHIKAASAIIDGEIVVPAADGPTMRHGRLLFRDEEEVLFAR
jgi:ATP-dependent DNA ligase